MSTGGNADFGGLTDLALVAGLNVPFDIGFEGWPPEAVEEGAVRGVKTLVSEFVVGIANERVPNGGAGV